MLTMVTISMVTVTMVTMSMVTVYIHVCVCSAVGAGSEDPGSVGELYHRERPSHLRCGHHTATL